MRTAEQIKKEIKEKKEELSHQNCMDWILLLEDEIEELKEELEKVNG